MPGYKPCRHAYANRLMLFPEVWWVQRNECWSRGGSQGVGQLAARTENNRVVNFDGPKTLVGEFADLQIIEALPNSLRGKRPD